MLRLKSDYAWEIPWRLNIKMSPSCHWHFAQEVSVCLVFQEVCCLFCKCKSARPVHPIWLFWRRVFLGLLCNEVCFMPSRTYAETEETCGSQNVSENDRCLLRGVVTNTCVQSEIFHKILHKQKLPVPTAVRKIWWTDILSSGLGCLIFPNIQDLQYWDGYKQKESS